MLEEERRDRLRRAGERFREAERVRREAAEELKAAMRAADGDSTPHEVAELTGLSVVDSAVLLAAPDD